MPNETDHVDHSKWIEFFNEQTVFASNEVLKQMIKDIQDEQNDRLIISFLENDESDLSEELNEGEK